MAQPTNVFMKSKDAISARMAECFVTIGDRRYNFMQIINFEAKIDKTKSKVPRLGTIMIRCTGRHLLRQGALQSVRNA